MLTGKQKRFLRAMGSGLDPVVHIGKGGINSNLIKQVDEALEAREIIKIKLLQNCMLTPEESAEELLKQTGAFLVQVIGKNVLLYRESREKPRLQLP